MESDLQQWLLTISCSLHAGVPEWYSEFVPVRRGRHHSVVFSVYGEGADCTGAKRCPILRCGHDPLKPGCLPSSPRRDQYLPEAIPACAVANRRELLPITIASCSS